MESLEDQRCHFDALIATAHRQDDPLAVYVQFVDWTLNNYGENNPQSGLHQLLKNATEIFSADIVYKTDLRYLKLWTLYTRQINPEEAKRAYQSLMKKEIGISFALLYEEYASTLEFLQRYTDARSIYRMGIKRSARPLERLKENYNEFKRRCSAHLQASTTRTQQQSQSQGSPNENDTAQPSSSHTASTGFFSTPASRYALMLAPPVAGKRAEKLRFDLSLLYTEGGGEFCIQEARARSMGLLGKRWSPLPITPPPRKVPTPPSHLAAPQELRPSRTESQWESQSPIAVATTALPNEEPQNIDPPLGLVPIFKPPPTPATIPVSFNDDGKKSTGAFRRKSVVIDDSKGNLNSSNARRKSMMYAEPTVTINTKEALADVFGMYNSPDKTTKLTGPGHKHAPVKKVNVITPIALSRVLPSEDYKTPTAFQPYIDQQPKENKRTPKFTPYVDNDAAKKTFVTPKQIQVFRDSVITPSFPRQNNENNVNKNENSGIKVTKLKPDENAISRIFTPARSQQPPLAPLRDVFTDDFGKPQPKFNTHQRAKSHHDAILESVEDDGPRPFRVFTRPESEENAIPPSLPPPPPLHRDIQPPKPTFQPSQDPPPEPVVQRAEAAHNLSYEPEGQDDDHYDDDYDAPDEYVVPLPEDEEDEEGYYDREEELAQEVPLGGRFGQFNVMTPITERTFEFTASTRFTSTPSIHLHRVSEGQEFEDDDQSGEGADDDYSPDSPQLLLGNPPFATHDFEAEILFEQAGKLSLADTLTRSTNFRPPNPCHPFDPYILDELLSLSHMSQDLNYYDLRMENANALENLQKFAKKARKTSGNTSNSGVFDSGSYPLVLNDQRFHVSHKLGEGGYGAVFQAKDMGQKIPDEDEDSDEDDDDDLDEENASFVAIKAVKPHNLWEYHVLRRLYNILPRHLQPSVVKPHALYAFRDESFLVMELCTQGSLLNIVNNATAAGISQQGACLDELLVVFFTIELLRLLESMHDLGFIHGDLKIDNCLLRLQDVPGGNAAWLGTYQPSGDGGWSSKGLKVIDFGRTIHTKLFPNPNQQFLADWQADEGECPEIREHKPWTFQTDYYGLAGIIYCMLFGKYMQESAVTSISTPEGKIKMKIATPLKRYWQTQLWNEFFDAMLNPCDVNPGGKLPIEDEMRRLRSEMESWLQANCNRTSNTLKGLLKKVERSCLQ